MNDNTSNDPLLKAIDDIKTENHKRLGLLIQKVKFLEEYLSSSEVFKRTEIKFPDGNQEVTISIEGVLADISDLFLIRRDKDFLSACLKIIQDKFQALNNYDALNLIKAKRIQEIQYSLDKEILKLEESLKSIQKELLKEENFWNEIDTAEKALLYLPQYKYIKYLLKEVEVTGLDKNSINKQMQRFNDLDDKYRLITQSIDVFEIIWTD